jgi:hypothetical protein
MMKMTGKQEQRDGKKEGRKALMFFLDIPSLTSFLDILP